MIPAEKLSKALITQTPIERKPSQLDKFKRFVAVWSVVVVLGMVTVTRFVHVEAANYSIDRLNTAIVDATQKQARLDAKIASLENPAHLQVQAAVNGAQLATSYLYVPFKIPKPPVKQAVSRWAQVVAQLKQAVGRVLPVF